MNNLINKHNLKVIKITKENNLTVIKTPLDKYVFKNADISIYNYLLSRGFDYFPTIIDYNDKIIMFEYIDNIEYDVDEKAEDYIRLLSQLHIKTSYYKKISSDEYRLIYEKILNRLIDLRDYYDYISNIIESKEYMSPSEYLVIRNISNIYMMINYAFKILDEWYKEVKNYTKKRVVMLYNNIDLNNMIKSTKSIFFTDFSNTKIDIPIYDLYNFYNKYYQNFDFVSLVDKYEKIYKLSSDEKKLLDIYISIPDKININSSIDNTINIKNQIRKLYSSINVLYSKKEENTSTHETENN